MKLPELPPETAPAVREAFGVLARESAELRAEVDALKGALAARSVGTTGATQAAVVTPVAPRRGPAQQWADRSSEPAPGAGAVRPPVAPVARQPAHLDFEKLLGRYGAWAAAALMILLGVGTLLEWAIRNGLFGPGARVASSSAVAVALAVGGYVLRGRAAARGESRGFGNACLGLALGVLDVVAWQIGPHWRMVPPSLALVLADLGATAVVSLGVHEEDELLAAVGAAGLYLAPFVTSSGAGSPLILASYVVLVSLVLFRFVAQETWRVTRAVIRWGSLFCVLALIAMSEAVLGAVAASVLAVAMLSIDTPVVVRLRLVTAYMVAAIVATFAASPGARTAWNAALPLDRHSTWLASVALLVAMTLVSWFTLRATSVDDFASMTGDRPEVTMRHRSPLSMTLMLLLPVAVVLAAAAALPGDTTLDLVWLNLAAGLVALAVALWSDAPLASNYYTTGFVLLWAAALSYSSRGAQVSEAMLLGIALVALWVASVRRDVGVARIAAFVSAAYVALVSAVQMYAAESRAVPHAWLDVALMAGACVVLVVMARQHVDGERNEVRVVRMLAPWIAGLLLARHLVVLASGSYTAVALTAFYAVTGVALIVMGRQRGSVGMRRGGLALSLYAPCRAIVTAADVENTGARVAAYFVAGAFMLLVAFLYRSRGRATEPILADVVEHE